MRVPASITFSEDAITVDGVRISLMVIPQMLYELTHPDPRKWYRFERVDDAIIVHVKITEDEPNGSRIASSDDAGRSSQDSRQ